MGDVKNEESDEQEVETDAEGVQGGLRGVAKQLVVDNNFDSFVQFIDLTDNCNTENKKINKARDIIRTSVCKFSKNKKGFILLRLEQ